MLWVIILFFTQSVIVSNLSNGVDTRLTLTRDASSIFTMYVNGAKVVSFSDTIGRANFGSNPAHFFIDDVATSQREAGAGAVEVGAW